MADRVLLSASPENIEACVDLALDCGAGIEMMTFAYPDTLDGDWARLVKHYRTLLGPVRGMISIHGPFMDMAPGSPDRRVNVLARERYEHAIRIAAELGAELVVFHANFIANIQTEVYRRGWHNRNVDFWGDVADYAEVRAVRIAIENMWEFDPDIIGDVLKAVNHPYLGACLDIGHARLYSQVPFETWVDALNGRLFHTHMNNNDGVQDIHRAFDYIYGPIDYRMVLKQLRALPNPPSMTLEMDTVEDMRTSLSYINLPGPDLVWRRRVVSSG